MTSLQHRILTAQVVYSGLGTPREGGAVVLQGEGEGARIVMLASQQDARRRYPDAPTQHVGFAISPPPVNAHTHLDLSTLPTFTGVYEDFIRHVILHTKQVRGVAAAREGLANLRDYGARAFGDVVENEEVMRFLLQEPGLEGVAYWEVIGPNPDDAERIFAETVERLRVFRRLERPDGLKLGLSPHTPHTVSAPLLQKLSALAQRERLPLQIHVAESPAEIPLHLNGSGPLFELIKPWLGAWRPSGLTPVQYLAELGVLKARPTLVHMVNVSEEDVKTVAHAGCAVVHCPRSNEALRCGRFPWELYSKYNVEVAFGTDSSGSAPDLNIEHEVAAARALHGDKASPLALVRAVVKGGYRALGLTPPRFGRGDPAKALYLWKLP